VPRVVSRVMAAASSLALAAILATAGAGPVAADTDVSWTTFTTYPANCNGELVIANGTAHNVTIRAADGSWYRITQFHLSVDGWYGNPYILNWQERNGYNADRYLYTSRQLVISKGAVPNMLNTYTLVITYNPFSFESVWLSECRAVQ
jgi:hypothetical protein